MNDTSGYTDEKADKHIQEHEELARQLEEAADKMERGGDLESTANYNPKIVADYRREAEKERRKVENMKALKRYNKPK